MVSASPSDGERAFTQPQPTRLWIFSDLHQEYADNAWDPTPPPGGYDAIIAAGDISSPLDIALGWLHDRFAGERIIYTPGNHDYWSWGDRNDTRNHQEIEDAGRTAADRLGITLLLDDETRIGGLRLLGGTLWTDYRHQTLGLRDATARAQKGLNDYRRIRRPSSSGRRNRRIEPATILARHRATRAFLADRLARPHDGPTAILTHHAPHPGSLTGSTNRDGLDHCYASDLTDLILGGRPDLWIHGHWHARADHRIGSTKIISNPRGHAEEPSAAAFDPHLILEI